MNTVYRPAFPIIGGGVDSLLIGIVEKNQNFTRKIKYFPRKRKKIRRVRKGNVFFFFFSFSFFFYSRERKSELFEGLEEEHLPHTRVRSLSSFFRQNSSENI